MKKKDIKIETFRGKGPGGQHKNKTDSCVRATHIPTGICVIKDGRDQATNKRLAIRELEKRLADRKREQQAQAKKQRRDEAIHNTPTIRTYDFKHGVVIDHRSKKKASIKNVLDKGKIDLLK